MYFHCAVENTSTVLLSGNRPEGSNKTESIHLMNRLYQTLTLKWMMLKVIPKLNTVEGELEKSTHSQLVQRFTYTVTGTNTKHKPDQHCLTTQ